MLGPSRLYDRLTALAIAVVTAHTTPLAAAPDESPFLAENAAAMDRMMAGMAVAPSGDIDRDFAAMMIPHHQGAIDMARAQLRYGKNEVLRRLAQQIIIDQQQEIALMQLALAQRAARPTAVGRRAAAPRHAHPSAPPRVAAAPTHVGRLQRIESYLAHRFAFLRFDYSTGDAAGQNMVGKATMAACEWLAANRPEVRHFFLDSHFGSDKKVSYINSLRTRGKRVTAEVTIPREVLLERLHVTPEEVGYWANIGSVGSHIAGAMNNGLHAANAIAAIFIATGQDVANVVEASAATTYVEVTPSRDLYAAITIPSLIVATHGGGTHLATQRECLEIMSCYGTDRAQKLAEIIAGVVLAGELSLGSAIVTREWVTAHERFGRNR